MDSQTQPECPAEYAMMVEDSLVYDPDPAMMVIYRVTESPRKNAFGSWTFAIMTDGGEEEHYCHDFRPVVDPSELEALRARLEEAEARASAEAAKVARVKALLDGIGPELDAASNLVDIIDEDDQNCYCDDFEDVFYYPFKNFAKAVREVLSNV